MGRVKIGWAEESITPDKKISLVGQFAERISEYVEKPLTCTAMAVECDDDQFIIISCDLGSVSYLMCTMVREAIAKKCPEIDTEKVILNAIHTHTGYGLGGGHRISIDNGGFKGMAELMEQFLKPGQKYVEAVNTKSPDLATMEELRPFFVERASKAAIDAWNSREEAGFANAFDRAAIGMCRRVAYSDDTAQMWGDANTAVFTELEGGNDSGVELMYCFGKDDKLKGIVVNLACPAQCVQHRLFVSPDFWGETKKLLRERFGEDIFMLPLCSAAGDQCPVDLVRWVNPDTDVHDPNLIRNNPPVRKADPSMFDLAGMKKAGKRVANAVFDAWDDGIGELQKEIKFEHHVHNMQLPLRRATLTEYNDAMKAIKDFCAQQEGDINYVDLANLQRYIGIIKRFGIQEKIECIDTEVHIIRMGSIAIATNPFELFLDFGNQIKARAYPEQTFLIQLCCGSEGYLPTEKAERHGHYSAFIGSGQVGHEGGDLLVRETLKDINKLFENDYKVYEYKE
ncbi:MAG: hypothetical protein Q4B67_00550 [Eubacteriales bacterium]|nr:hypothetical protein [Eubacteriales bacterium]